ncbi:hypothetical protein CERSUDRAFT_116197 [Gelatoporia subvermispora B]|uniref:Mid2 domain-containing protein n=1 Tax=Ceriporiopsis subvermispora (strain B) TaxID=914234 RepID=M2QTP6_CERS8|nr:hypothetical protein CERSUDRAFT_116197 [Gelatoporia subvermispora B]
MVPRVEPSSFRPATPTRPLMLALAALAVLPSLANAYSFSFGSTPQQCQNLTIDITGTGQPPYSVLLIPFGPSTLPNNVEVRKITQVNFTGDATSASFQLKYPTDSQFVLVVSDATGFGSGGTSVAATVQGGSNDSSCFDASTNVAPLFDFSVFPNNQLVQCATTRVWWQPDNASMPVFGTPQFHGVIPGGQSFTVPEGPLSTVVGEGLGFNWTVPVRTGTTVLLLGGDDRGIGTAGSGFYIVAQGSNSCLNTTSPSSTPGSPAGGSYPTTTNGAGTGGSSSGSHTNVGAIVGGVIGGVVGALTLGLILFFIQRRRVQQHAEKERPVDLLQDHDRESDDAHPPQYYEPEPFLVPDPTAASSAGSTAPYGSSTPYGGLRPSVDRRASHISGTTAEGSSAAAFLRAGTPDMSASGSSGTRKSPAPPTFRPVNIIQHDDAGPQEQGQEEPETIELPPAYTNIRRAEVPPPESPPPEPEPAPRVPSPPLA